MSETVDKTSSCEPHGLQEPLNDLELEGLAGGVVPEGTGSPYLSVKEFLNQIDPDA